MGEPAFERMGVLGGELFASAGRHTDDHGHVELAAGHVQDGSRVVEDLVQSEQAEVDGHDFDDGQHAGHGGADSCACVGGLAERGVDDAVCAVLLEHALGDAEAAAVCADVGAHEEDALVARDGCTQGFAHGLAIGDGAFFGGGLLFGRQVVQRGGVHVLGEHEAREVLDRLQRAVLSKLHSVLDLRLCVLLDLLPLVLGDEILLLQEAVEGGDGVAMAPLLNFGLGAVELSVEHGVGSIAVGLGLEELGALAVADGIHSLFHGGFDGENVHAVDDFGGHTLADGLGGDVGDGLVQGERGAHAVVVVLADEKKGNLPQGSQVQGFLELAFSGGAVTEEADGDTIASKLLVGESHA